MHNYFFKNPPPKIEFVRKLLYNNKQSIEHVFAQGGDLLEQEIIYTDLLQQGERLQIDGQIYVGTGGED